MLMGLCLLVYSLGQRSLRHALEGVQQTIDNQVGRPTTKPTCSVVVLMFHVDSFVDN
jgi:transposase